MLMYGLITESILIKSSMTFAIDMRPSQEGMGGIAEYTSMVARTCAELAPEHTFVLFFSGLKVTLPSWVLDYKNVITYIHRVPNKITNTALYLYQRPALDSLIKKSIPTPIDVWLLPNLHFISLSRSQKSVMTVHDVSFQRYPEFYSAKQRWWHGAVKPRMLLSQSQHLLAVSQYTKDDMVKEFGIPESKITVTPLGINAAYTQNISSTGKEVQTPGRSIVASTAHDPRKNIAAIVQGYCILRKNNPYMSDVSLHLVGRKGKWVDQLRFVPSAFRSSIHVYHNLSYAALADLTRRASVFVYPSFYEGFGLPLLEAMAAGIPVISSPNSAILETAGDSAYYTDPYNPYAMSRALDVLLSDASLRVALSEKGKQRAAGYTWHTTAEKTLAALERIAATQ